MDTSPGLLNGMLSLLLNHTAPRVQVDAANGELTFAAVPRSPDGVAEAEPTGAAA